MLPSVSAVSVPALGAVKRNQTVWLVPREPQAGDGSVDSPLASVASSDAEYGVVVITKAPLHGSLLGGAGVIVPIAVDVRVGV